MAYRRRYRRTNRSTYARGDVSVDRYDSPADFAAVAGAVADRSHGGGSEWYGSTREQAIASCVTGDLSAVADAERLIDDLTTDYETPRSTWVASPCGAFPIVPEFLAGHPDSMRRRVLAETQTGPVRLYIDTVCSAAVGVPFLRMRGAALLALTMALVRFRPVELWAVMPMGYSPSAVTLIRIPTAPLDLAIACGVLCNPGVTRDLAYGLMMGARGTDGNWYKGLRPDPDYPNQVTTYTDAIKTAIGADAGDLYIAPIYSQRADAAGRDPKAFIRSMLDLAVNKARE